MTDRAETLKAATGHLKQAYEKLLHAQAPGAGFPPPDVLRLAQSAAHAGLDALEELLAGPDPYADKTLRPGLNYIDPTARFPEPQETPDV